MSLLNLGFYPAHSQRQAASLKATVVWYARRVWESLEAAGRRRAAGELARLALRMKSEGHPLAEDMLATARDCARTVEASQSPISTPTQA